MFFVEKNKDNLEIRFKDMTIINYESSPQLKMIKENKYELVQNQVINFASNFFFKVIVDKEKEYFMKLVSKSDSDNSLSKTKFKIENDIKIGRN